MPRQPRQFEVGSIYHIIQRGVEKRKIFLKPQDYSRFILSLEFLNSKDYTNIWELITKAGPGPASERIAKEREKHAKPLVEILAFALMPNHYHLIIREIRPGGVSLFMSKLGGYTTYFNRQYDRVGPLFQSRYKFVLIETDVQLNNLFTYVHTNPVELKEPKWKEFKVENKRNAINWLETYKWSSYHDYVGNPTFPNAINRDFFLDLYGGEGGCRQVVEDWIKFKAQNSQMDLRKME